jgi:AmiR/NasT family two-component response regulator
MRSQTGGSAEEAFDKLRRTSQSENLELAQIARNVVDQAVQRAVLQQ